MHQNPKGASTPYFETNLPPRTLKALPPQDSSQPVIGTRALMFSELPPESLFCLQKKTEKQLLGSVEMADP